MQGNNAKVGYEYTALINLIVSSRYRMQGNNAKDG